MMWVWGGIGAIVAALFLGLIYHAGQLGERSKWQDQVIAVERRNHALETQLLNKKHAAEVRYVERETIRQPIIERARETVRTYEKTVAGQSVCLAADIVRTTQSDRQRILAGDPAGAAGADREMLGDPVADQP